MGFLLFDLEEIKIGFFFLRIRGFPDTTFFGDFVGGQKCGLCNLSSS